MAKSSIIDLPPDAEMPVLPVPDDSPELDTSPIGQVVENEDGSADIMEPEDDTKDTAFYDNLAEDYIDEKELKALSSDLLEKLELDKESRKRRDEQYEEGLRRTGLGDDAPGGATFSGSSKVVHPLLAEACIDFSARTMKELMPPRGPVRISILSKSNSGNVDAAELKAKVLNWQLTKQIREYRDELEQLTTQEPMGGSQFLKVWHDTTLNRHRVEFIPIDNLLLPFSASGLYMAERATHVQNITRMTFEQRVDSGLYRDVSVGGNDPMPERTASEKANEKIEGKSEDAYNEDGLRTIFEVYVNHAFEDDERPLPYIVHIDKYSEKVLAVYRNWNEEDEQCEKLDWIVEFKFIPWRGAYGIGLPHLIGGISGALTGALRALLDSAHINNAATMLKLKGVRGGGTNTQVEVTQICEIEAPPNIDDIRKIAMPMPFNPPSTVLFQLLGFLADTGKGVVGTAEEAMSESSTQMPVGTTLALIEQGSQVYSSIHTRHHFAQQRVFDIICRLNKQYPESLNAASEALKQEISSDLFDENSDIEPISDPNIFSETQRYAQIQAVLQLSQDQSVPYDRVKLHRIAMQRMKFDQADEVLPPEEKPQRTDPVNENVFATKGLPIQSFMEQDHMGHLITHLTFCVSPMFGKNPLMTIPAVPALLNHCKDHLAMLYSQHARASTAAIMDIHGAQGGTMDEGEAQTMKTAISLAEHEMATLLGPIMPMFQEAQQIGMSAAPKPPMDPQSQVALQLGQAEIQRKTQLDQATIQMDQAAAQAKAAAEQSRIQMDMAEAQAEKQREMQQQQFDQWMTQQTQQREHDRAVMQAQIDQANNEADNRQHQLTELLKNKDDNDTAIIIEQMKEALGSMQPQVQGAEKGRDAMSMVDDAPIMQQLQGMMQNVQEKLIAHQQAQEQARQEHAQRLQDQSTHASNLKAVLDHVQNIAAYHAAPKKVVRDQTGNVIGIETHQGVRRVVRDEQGNMTELEG